MECDHTPPALLELAYHLIYTLCSNPDTSSPTMRYLRNTQDFFIKTLCKLKFSHNEGKCRLDTVFVFTVYLL